MNIKGEKGLGLGFGFRVQGSLGFRVGGGFKGSRV